MWNLTAIPYPMIFLFWIKCPVTIKSLLNVDITNDGVIGVGHVDDELVSMGFSGSIFNLFHAGFHSWLQAVNNVVFDRTAEQIRLLRKNWKERC